MSDSINLQVANAARESFSRGDIEGYLTTLYAPDVSAHFLPPGMPPGIEGLRLYYSAFHAAFPDAQLHFDEIVSEGDRLAIRFHLEMTHTGEFNGIPATHKRVSFEGTTIMRFVDGKVVERWSESDSLGMLQQLGVVPALS
jgi:predicted ester cyclase